MGDLVAVLGAVILLLMLGIIVVACLIVLIWFLKVLIRIL